MERLQGVVRDRRANWAQSLGVLRAAKEAGAGITKTSIMMGCGETPDEVVAALRTLRENGEANRQLRGMQYAMQHSTAAAWPAIPRR